VRWVACRAKPRNRDPSYAKSIRSRTTGTATEDEDEGEAGDEVEAEAEDAEDEEEVGMGRLEDAKKGFPRL
jgi:hypothetical protein